MAVDSAVDERGTSAQPHSSTCGVKVIFRLSEIKMSADVYLLKVETN